MADITPNPSNLTKDRLRIELERFGVDLPPFSAKKDVYVNLYKTHISSQRSEFSSDEEPEIQKKTKPGSPRKSMSKKSSSAAVDVTNLSDAQLSSQLKEFGEKNCGPILDTTRRLYQKKLANLLAGKTKVEASKPPKHESQSSHDSHDTLILDEAESEGNSIWNSKRSSNGSSLPSNWASKDTEIIDKHERPEFSDSDLDAEPVQRKTTSSRKLTTYKTEVKDSPRKSYTEPPVVPHTIYTEPPRSERTTYISYEEQMEPDSPGRYSRHTTKRRVKEEISHDSTDGSADIKSDLEPKAKVKTKKKKVPTATLR